MMHHSSTPKEMVLSIFRNRYLIKTLVKREVLGRYRGSVMGMLWSFLNPLFMLTVYTFVFSVIFQARWGGAGESKTEFALILFAGLIVFNLFSECINRAPTLVLSNTNYVKKVVFPLETLPCVVLGSAIFHMLVSLCVWFLAYVFFNGMPEWTALWLPVVILPLVLAILGLSWILASLGVFLRDVSQFIGIITTVMMFLSPIFYPVSAIPESYRIFIYLNPLTLIIEQVRNILFWGQFPDLKLLAAYGLFSMTLAWFGFTWYQKTRKGFADVI